MVMLRPFSPLRYNPAVIGDLAAVVAPPYDVIPEAHRNALYERSERNVIRLILNRSADPYATAAELLQAWRRDGVLVRDRAPALCRYVQDFVLPNGEARQREGIIGTVRLEPFSSGQIRPHERTLARPKEDRMRLLRACRTNLSPLFALFADKLQVLEAAQGAATRPPDIDLRDDADVRHRLWLLTEASVIEAISAPLAEESIVIADGHHRYETAQAYSEERRAQGGHDPDAPYNFVLMYVTSMSHPGLVILPTHRVLLKSASFDAPKFTAQLQRHFRLRRFPRSAREAFLAALHEPPQLGRFGVVSAGADDLVLATLDDSAVADQYAGHLHAVVRRLDVPILDSVILRGLIGIDVSAAAQDGRLAYMHDDVAALDAVEQGAQVALLMNPPDVADVQAVCLAGQTMPEKSTYFYPKLLSGLVFHPLEPD
ncbi:MAG: DUF1015 domain-containing protein [Candidatus Binatia bacterium]|jgi:uncharacterized protein (DUF1015 family)